MFVLFGAVEFGNSRTALSLLVVIVVVNCGIATYFSSYYTYFNTAYVHCFAVKIVIIMLPFSLSLMMIIEYWLLP